MKVLTEGKVCGFCRSWLHLERSFILWVGLCRYSVDASYLTSTMCYVNRISDLHNQSGDWITYKVQISSQARRGEEHLLKNDSLGASWPRGHRSRYLSEPIRRYDESHQPLQESQLLYSKQSHFILWPKWGVCCLIMPANSRSRYAQLLAALYNTSVEEDQFVSRICSIVGAFNLNQSRVLDIVLEAFEMNLSENRYYFALLDRFDRGSIPLLLVNRINHYMVYLWNWYIDG